MSGEKVRKITSPKKYLNHQISGMKGIPEKDVGNDNRKDVGYDNRKDVGYDNRKDVGNDNRNPESDRNLSSKNKHKTLSDRKTTI